MCTTACDRMELELIDYMDGTLTGERLAAVEAHLASCENCSRQMEDMRRILTETAALAAPVPEDLHEKIMARVAAEARPTGRLLRFVRRKTVAVAASIVLLLCVGTVAGVALAGGNKGMDAVAEAEDVAFYAANNGAGATYEYSAAEAKSISQDDMISAQTISEDGAAEESIEEEYADEDLAAPVAPLPPAEAFSDARDYQDIWLLSAESVPAVLEEVLLTEAEIEKRWPELEGGYSLAEIDVEDADALLVSLQQSGCFVRKCSEIYEAASLPLSESAETVLILISPLA